MNTPRLSIVLRSFNEGWALRETLPALAAQNRRDWELIVIDSGSTDGSVDLIRAAQPAHLVQIPAGAYVPGRVLNQGFRLARAPLGIFLNADATPQCPDWLDRLARPLDAPRVAASFSRQVPRPDCRAVFACDYERCFGPDRESAQWDHFFSMVSSGLRRDVWETRGFREDLTYAEDDEYTRWCRAQGFEIAYVPESVVMHSHNYSPGQAHRRAFGDARTLAAIGRVPRGGRSFIRTVLLGWLRDLRRDAVYCQRRGRLAELPHAALIRACQRLGRWAGLRQPATVPPPS